MWTARLSCRSREMGFSSAGGEDMARHRTAEEKAAFKVRAADMRLAGIGVRRIASELHISRELAQELLADVPAPGSLLRSRAKDDHRETAVALRLEGRT